MQSRSSLPGLAKEHRRCSIIACCCFCCLCYTCLHLVLYNLIWKHNNTLHNYPLDQTKRSSSSSQSSYANRKLSHLFACLLVAGQRNPDLHKCRALQIYLEEIRRERTALYNAKHALQYNGQ